MYLVHVKKKIAMAIRACLQESFVLREESHIPRINSSQYLVIFLLLKLHGFGVGMGSCQSKSTRMNWHSSIQCNKRAFSIGTEDQCKGAESWKNLLLGGISLHKMSQVRYMYQYLPSMQVPEVNVKVYNFFRPGTISITGQIHLSSHANGTMQLWYNRPSLSYASVPMNNYLKTKLNWYYCTDNCLQELKQFFQPFIWHIKYNLYKIILKHYM